MGFSRQEYWSGLPFPSPGDLPDPGIEPRSPTLQADALPSEPPGKLKQCIYSSGSVCPSLETESTFSWKMSQLITSLLRPTALSESCFQGVENPRNCLRVDWSLWGLWKSHTWPHRKALRPAQHAPKASTLPCSEASGETLGKKALLKNSWEPLSVGLGGRPAAPRFSPSRCPSPPVYSRPA